MKLSISSTLIGFLILCASLVYGQSIEELETQLKNATTTSEKIQLNYQLGEAYKNSNRRDNEKPALRYAKAAHQLATQSNLGMAARSAFLVASIYKDERDERNQEVWFRTAESFAKRAQDSDLIIKSVVERGRLASRERNYRRAAQIYEDAFTYFSQKGTSISELESKFEQEKAELERQKRQLEQERQQLQQEVGALSSERDELAVSQDELQREVEKVEEQISTKTEELESVDEARRLAERLAAQEALKAKQFSREKLEQEYLKEQAENARIKAEMDRERAEYQAAKNREVTFYTSILAGFLVVVALFTYARFTAKRRANLKLEEKNKIIEEERKRSDGLLLNILPAPIAAELKEKGKAGAQKFDEVSVMFSDFKNFTGISEQLSPEELVEELDKSFQAFDRIIGKYPTIEKIKTIGDAYMCATGLNDRKVMPFDLVRAALEMQDYLAEQKRERERIGKPFFEARIGIHTGPVVAGVVGFKKFSYDIWGDTVNTAARVESNGQVGRVNISETTYRLVKYKFECTYRGRVQAKNKGELDMYFVEREVD